MYKQECYFISPDDDYVFNMMTRLHFFFHPFLTITSKSRILIITSH